MLSEVRMTELARAQGFEAAVVNTDDIVTNPDYRKYCEDNLCGNYNANYGCPPYCGTPAEMDSKLRSFRRGMVLKTSAQVTSALNADEVVPMKKNHNKGTLRLLRQLVAEGLTAHSLVMAGPCGLCEECKMKSGEPCQMENARYSCLSAYCIDVTKLAETAGMPIAWTVDQAAFFSIVLF